MGSKLHRSVLAALCAAAMSPLAARADFYWVGGSGAWNDPANWSNSPGGAGGVGVPADGDWVFVTPSDSTDRTIQLTPGNSTFSSGRFEAGAGGTGSLTFNITQGTFAGADELFGGGSTQLAVVQTGGVNLGAGVQLQASAGHTSTYDLTGAQFVAQRLWLGGSDGSAIFRQHSGSVQLDNLRVQINSRYELSSGTLVTGFDSSEGTSLWIFNGGTFAQNGGTHTVTEVDDEGRYEWNGGTLNIVDALRVSGEFIFPNASTTLSMNGLVDISAPSATLTNASSLTLNLSSTSMLIHSAAQDPASIFAAYNNLGFDHVAGTTLAIPAGRTLLLSGSFNDAIDCTGTIAAQVGRYFELNGTLLLRSGGLIDTNAGIVRFAAGTSEIQGGQLLARSIGLQGDIVIGIPPKPTPTVVQSGGAVTADSLEVFQGTGTYVLNDGSITTQLTRFGKASALVVQLPTFGTMIQNNGTHTTGALMLGQGTGSSGTYILNGGTLRAGSITVSAPLSGFGFPPPPPTYGNGRLEINSSSASVAVSEGMTFGPSSSYAAVPGTIIHFTGPGYFSNMSKDPSALAGLENTTLLFETGDADASSLEAASTDLGPTLSGFVGNFAVDKLQIGGADVAAVVLSDVSINHPDSFGVLPTDAVYVNTLMIGPGSSLDLNNINLYCLNLINNGEILSGGGQLTVVPEPGTLLGFAAGALLAARRRK
jgi:hypothetical protein